MINGLRYTNTGIPCFNEISREHTSYLTALKKNGVQVHLLPLSERWPDSLFVEDPALVFPQGAIILRSIREERAGERDLIEPVLRSKFAKVLEIDNGYVDGGDVLCTSDNVIIGLSSRTTQEGAERLVKCLSNLGLSGTITDTPHGVLHLKSDCSLLDEKTVFVTPRLAVSQVFKNYKKIITPETEYAAANAIRINSSVFVNKDCVKSIALLKQSGFKTTALPSTEIRKLDGGLSCMSLRWLNL